MSKLSNEHDPEIWFEVINPSSEVTEARRVAFRASALRSIEEIDPKKFKNSPRCILVIDMERICVMESYDKMLKTLGFEVGK